MSKEVTKGMEKYIRKSIVFFSIGLAYFIMVGGLNYMIYSHRSVDLGKCSKLIAGDSHPQKSLNPEFLDGAVNIAQLAEPYVMTYWKLKKILVNNHPDTVLIGFAPHNISVFNDQKFFHQHWSHEMFKRIYPIAQFDDLSGIEVDYKTYYKVFLKQICIFPKLKHGDYIGSHLSLSGNNLKHGKSRVAAHFPNEKEEEMISKTAVAYLDSIVSRCKRANAVPVLVSHPVHHSYYKHIPEPYINAYHRIEDDMKQKGVYVINKTTVEYADSLFLNVDHLNKHGAEKFTKEVSKELSAIYRDAQQ